MKRLAIIGTGRIATSLALALAAVPLPGAADGEPDGWRMAAFIARDPASASARRAAALTGLPVQSLNNGPEVLASADLVVMAVSDRAIRPLAQWLAEQEPLPAAVAHCAGSIGAEALAALASRGVATGSLHPLQTVAVPDGDAFAGAWCCVDGDERIRPLLLNLATATGMRPFTLSSAARARYHAAAALASNALVALAAAAAEAMPLSDGLSPLLPLMRKTLANLERVGLPDALTGPVERGDVETVRRHLAALTGLPLAERAYRALADVTLAVALRKGSLDEEHARALKTLLETQSTAHGGDRDDEADHHAQAVADEAGRRTDRHGHRVRLPDSTPAR